MKDLLIYIAKALVDHPDDVQVHEISGEHTTVLEVKVDATDRGKIIGKEGRIIKAIRTVVGASSAKSKKRCTVELIE